MWWSKRFPGMETPLLGTDLYRTHFRLYSANQGRWLSPDPIAGSVFNPQSLNRYAYVLNNPTNFIDPLGLDECQSSRDPQTCRDQYKPAETTRSGSPYNVGDSAQCIVDRAPVPCSMFFNMINAGWIHGAESARIINGVLVLEGGWIDRENGRVGIWTTLIPLSPEFTGAIDEAYGEVLGTLGKVFRGGRMKGQSFAACVDENIRLTTFGAVESSTKTLAVAAGGVALTAAKSPIREITALQHIMVVLGAWFLPLGAKSAVIYSASYVPVGVAIVGGAATGVFAGSLANCASKRVGE